MNVFVSKSWMRWYQSVWLAFLCCCGYVRWACLWLRKPSRNHHLAICTWRRPCWRSCAAITSAWSVLKGDGLRCLQCLLLISGTAVLKRLLSKSTPLCSVVANIEVMYYQLTHYSICIIQTIEPLTICSAFLSQTLFSTNQYTLGYCNPRPVSMFCIYWGKMWEQNKGWKDCS